MKYKSAIVLTFLFVIMSQPIYADARNQSVPRAELGHLDLTRWSLDKNGAVPLDGQWEFYWEQLLRPDDLLYQTGNKVPFPHYVVVPSTWAAQRIEGLPLSNQGYGTYRLTIRIHPGDRGKVLALAVPSVATAYSLWIDGEEKDRQGVVASSRGAMAAQNFTKTVYFSPTNETVELVLQVSNFVQRKGGVWASFTLGTDQEMTLAREKNIVLQIVVAGGLFIMGLHHIGLYLFRRIYKATLWFGIACVLICLRTLLTKDSLWTRLWPAFNWEWAVKLEYLSVYYAIGFLILYAWALYPAEMNRKLSHTLFAGICLLSIPVIAFPARVYTQAMLPSMLVLFAAMAYPVFGVILGVVRRKREAWINFGFIIIFFLTMANDILYYNFIVKTADLIPFGLYLLLFAQTLILAARFSDAFKQVEALSGELIEANKTLEQKIIDRTHDLVRTNERLSQMELSRRQMLANISHDFGTPLTALIGYVTVANEENGIPPHVRKYLGVIQDKAVLLQRLTDDLRCLALLESGHLTLHYKTVNLESFYNSIHDKYEFEVHAKGIDFIQEPMALPDRELPCFVRMDAARMDQVMNNLVSNAIAHTPSGGTITITARTFLRLKKVAISVTDTGIGIPKDEIAIIFKRFYKVRRSLRSNTRGHGLGLSIAREIMLHHGGKLGVRSQEGRGSTFYVLLPLYTEEQHVDQEPRA